MTWVLTRKLLRDIRIAWLVVALLLFLFQILWARIAQRITSLIGEFNVLGMTVEQLQGMVLRQDDLPGRMVQSIIGGDDIQVNKAGDFMTIAYVHPLTLTILSVWAIGRAANAIAGEIDRGTMELLLAQPIRRTQVITSHLLVDAVVFTTLCLTMWCGTYCGTWWMGLQSATNPFQRVDPLPFLAALPSVAGLLFAVSGVTMAISAMGRSRARVWGWAISLLLVMFLVNILGQIWEDHLAWLRPFTIYYYYLPQTMIRAGDWFANGSNWLDLLVLFGIGAAGYLGAWTAFTRRDLPAPL